jgi:hypothetical protein
MLPSSPVTTASNDGTLAAVINGVGLVERFTLTKVPRMHRPRHKEPVAVRE